MSTNAIAYPQHPGQAQLQGLVAGAVRIASAAGEMATRQWPRDTLPACVPPAARSRLGQRARRLMRSDY